MSRNFFMQLLIALDQLANVLLGGWADETLSARGHRQNHKTRWRRFERAVDNTIFAWDYEKNSDGTTTKHCELAYYNERHRAHIAPEYRDSEDKEGI